MAGLEELTSRPLAPRKGGRPKNPAADCRQATLLSAALVETNWGTSRLSPSFTCTRVSRLCFTWADIVRDGETS